MHKFILKIVLSFLIIFAGKNRIRPNLAIYIKFLSDHHKNFFIQPIDKI
jgi:hypothetical protein